MFTQIIKCLKKAGLFLLEFIFAIAQGRTPRFRQGGVQFLILLSILIIGFFTYGYLQSSPCLLCQNSSETENKSNILKESDFNPQSESSTSATEEISVDNNEYQTLYLVTKVIDGDTFEIASGQTVRLIGIDTPETVHPTKGMQCFGPEASSFTKSLLENKEVKLEKDVSETDQYGRLLRYIYLDNLFVNEYLVNEGYARVSTYPPDVKYQETFQKAEQSARDGNRGLWSANCDDSSSTVEADSTSCQIKGNISWSGEKIYHLVDCPYYNQTVINESSGEKYFCTEEEALAAGWHKASNCP